MTTKTCEAPPAAGARLRRLIEHDDEDVHRLPAAPRGHGLPLPPRREAPPSLPGLQEQANGGAGLRRAGALPANAEELSEMGKKIEAARDLVATARELKAQAESDAEALAQAERLV